MWPNPPFPADLVTFTEESLMENFIFGAVFISRTPNSPELSLKWEKISFNFFRTIF